MFFSLFFYFHHSMDQMLLFLLLATFLHSQLPLTLTAKPPAPRRLPKSHITVQGSVFCDVCYDNTFSRHGYFLPGANVHIQCKFKANSPGTTEQIAFSVNRTTDKYGVYKLDIPSIEGVDCSDDREIQFVCEVGLIGNASPASAAACNVPGLKSTTNEITLKSKQSNLCIYSMSALSYRPVSKNVSLCGNNDNKKFKFPYSLNSSKFFLPNFPPYYGIHWPPLPQFPPLPSLPHFPPFPSFPFTPLPPLPSLPPLPPLPSLPPLPPLPSLPPLPPFPFPPATIPRPPPQPPSSSSSSVFPSNPPPNYPFVSPPRPPAFNLADPRTWIPSYPPAPPSPIQP